MDAGIIAVVFLGVLSAWAQTIVDERNIRLDEKIKSQGYPAELHRVTTKDGYVLSLHRIPHGRDGSPGQRPVVFVMHGLMSASSHFVLIGPEYALAYNLADAGYDVWLGNQRGNLFSRKHTSLNPDDSKDKLEFFDFSWEDIGSIDIPAMVDYALATTGQEKLHYIGHSQGGTVFLVLNSLYPEYNEKFASAHLLAGVGYMENFPSAILKRVANHGTILYNLGVRIGLVEISSDALPLTEQVKIKQDSVADHCAGDPQYKMFCEMIGVNYLMDILSSNAEMGGASLKQLAHFGQNIRNGVFRRWDFGLFTNLRVYRSLDPPSFNLSKITVDVTMHYSASDVLLDEKDVLAMATSMPNASVRKVERDSFKHEDYIFSNDAKELVTDYIIEKLNNFSV